VLIYRSRCSACWIEQRGIMSKSLSFVAVIAAGLVSAQDPPSRVGRLNFITGSVSFQPGGADDWVPAAINRPLTVGDQIFADEGARAEIHIPGTAFRLGAKTSFEFMNLDDRAVQVRLSEGSLRIRVRQLEGDESLEVDTPNLAFTILRPGDYRVDTNSGDYQTYVTVRSGDGEITSNSGAFAVHARQQAVLTGQDQAQYGVYAAPDNDDFDNWAQSRDAREDRSQSSRYVSPNVVGYEDLDDNGSWQSVPGDGPGWMMLGGGLLLFTMDVGHFYARAGAGCRDLWR
jgi:ferric-dicitrate binding protein FerR (iron transport regulator)